ncbi:MAG: hypothetical protein OXF01_06695 [Gemmatimonadetes bacterium]|nr:hypothetical protein [Gemmatimonadota bacterium]
MRISRVSASRPLRAGCLIVLSAVLAAALPARNAAQIPPGRFIFAGEVRIGAEPADTGTVVLHRVSPTLSGSMDSVQVTDGGRFEFVVDTGADSAGVDVYFASIRYQGLLYFGAPVTGVADLVEAYVLRAYPSVGATPDTRLPVRVRNVFVEKAEPGPGWLVTDVFEVENGMEVSVVASEEAATWSHALPPGAFAFSVGRSDLAPEGASFSGGRVFVSTPFPPGELAYGFHYQLPEDRFTLPMEGATRSMELLFREPAGELTVTGLASVGPLELDGATFRRFAGREMAASVVVVEPGVPRAPLRSMPLLAVLLGLALTAAGSILVLRARLQGSRASDERRRGLLIAIARLDEAWNAGELAVEEYDRTRRRLLDELKD